MFFARPRRNPAVRATVEPTKSKNLPTRRPSEQSRPRRSCAGRSKPRLSSLTLCSAPLWRPSWCMSGERHEQCSAAYAPAKAPRAPRPHPRGRVSVVAGDVPSSAHVGQDDIAKYSLHIQRTRRPATLKTKRYQTSGQGRKG